MTARSVSPGVIGEEAGQRLVRLRQRARLGVGDRVVDLGENPVADPPRVGPVEEVLVLEQAGQPRDRDRKSTRLNSSHTVISYAVFCLKKKKKNREIHAYLSPTENIITT